jgi:tRNA U34 5-carboxymethylaminomethyl modifying GTPase MnmE/TrmE
MENNDFNLLQQEVQKIIDLIAAKKWKEANDKLVEISAQLDDFLDFSDDDADLIEISKYQVLLNQLHQKINELN